MQKAVLWVVSLVIIAGGWYLYSSKGAQTPTESSETPAQEADKDLGTAGQGENANTNVSPVTVKVGANSSVTTVIPAAVITFTDAGFVPSSVTVKKGQTVRWMNNSGAEVWPASAVHPTHSIYPQKSASDCLGSSFDACKGLKKGEAWDFTFNYVGAWRFHDHLHASKTGVVNVTE